MKDVSHVQTTVTLLMTVPLYVLVMMDTIELTLKTPSSLVQVTTLYLYVQCVSIVIIASPSQPIGLTATSIQSTTVTITWSQPSDTGEGLIYSILS